MVMFAKTETGVRYKFSAKVVKIRKNTKSTFSDANVENDAVILIPDYINQSSARRFLAAWLPDSDDPRDFFEIGLYLGHPVHAPARGAIRRKGPDCPEFHHIFVMSLSAEHDLLKDSMDGKTIDVEVMTDKEMEPTLQEEHDARPVSVPDIIE